MDWLDSAFATEVVSLALLHKAKRASATGPRDIQTLLLSNDCIINRARDVEVDLSRAHSVCIQSVAHLTAMELLKSSTEPGSMSDPTVLLHARCIHESALGFSKRKSPWTCPLQRLCWQEASAWFKQYRERILSLRAVDDPEVADLKSCISFLDHAVTTAER
ncbi:hypothetical protein M407DRAFT_125915 [Tulasnella calospora MUT 4182]|uniref:Uncharacterized protein n=1 Tax=Tulasnella calospora MUT 4182 TaxID=1051891 RepID=A0A0C3LJ49_9AGAM|nr:hypothetical protein M407DRAFT_125915 [Tulasnella calospora MUT 4182]